MLLESVPENPMNVSSSSLETPQWRWFPASCWSGCPACRSCSRWLGSPHRPGWDVSGENNGDQKTLGTAQVMLISSVTLFSSRASPDWGKGWSEHNEHWPRSTHRSAGQLYDRPARCQGNSWAVQGEKGERWGGHPELARNAMLHSDRNYATWINLEMSDECFHLLARSVNSWQLVNKSNNQKAVRPMEGTWKAKITQACSPTIQSDQRKSVFPGELGEPFLSVQAIAALVL